MKKERASATLLEVATKWHDWVGLVAIMPGRSERRHHCERVADEEEQENRALFVALLDKASSPRASAPPCRRSYRGPEHVQSHLRPSCLGA